MGCGGHIRVLPDNVANKIAAGEVVERPASVLKELLENAIDSGATRVDAEIAAGGRKLVAVADNGPGMTRDDALLSVERHATSKIADVHDIERIGTLGFRGEALAAISSVSRFRMTTCADGEVTGTEIIITGGTLRDVRDIGCPVGTKMEVRDLFFNVPARRKFLRSHQTELAHVRSGFILLALAHPEIGMTFKVDARDVHGLREGSEPEERIRELMGRDFLGKLRPLNRDRQGIRVRGHVSLPGMSRSDRNEQYIFVNGRATGASVINYAIREAYHALLPKGRHPSVLLFLEVDPGQVDVNVHPTKKEVRFRHAGEVRDAVIEAIREALRQPPLTGPPGTSRGPADGEAMETTVSVAAQPGEQMRIEDLPPARAFRYPRMPMVEAARPPRDGMPEPARGPEPTRGAEAAVPPEPDAGAAAPEASPWSWCRVVGQIGNLYVVLETEDGYVLMDPHAAHERVLFERFMADVIKGRVQSQSLLMPRTAELGPRDAARVRKNLDLLKEMGFGLSEFGGDAFVVDALPSYFADAPADALLVEVSTSLDRAGSRGGTERWREESIAQAACKSAVKARDRLTLEEIEQLVVDLARAEMPYTCPHGRPTLIFTSFKELSRKFGRE